MCCLLATAAMAEFQRTKIAVLDFEQTGDAFETKGLGPIAAEWFTTGMVKSGRFDVVERAMLQKILTEQKMAAAGIVDESSAAVLGRILGVKAVATGSVIKDRRTIEVNARVISVESGEIIAAESFRGNSEEELHGMIDQLTASIIRNFPLTGYVVKKATGSVVIDLGLDSGLAPGTEFIVYREGEVIRHPKTGEVLDVEQIHTGRLRITKISKNVAEGKILGEERGGIKDGQLVKSVRKEGKKPPPKSAKKSSL
ncbi:MAG: hypothetical protein A2X81_01310 [Desulfobacterales bacterium GWB2_56_26]|nr:MAG: hypothetical protein A2X81_01310 [Desulfobacterales bacterium GWB2_56_26]